MSVDCDLGEGMFWGLDLGWRMPVVRRVIWEGRVNDQRVGNGLRRDRVTVVCSLKQTVSPKMIYQFNQ